MIAKNWIEEAVEEIGYTYTAGDEPKPEEMIKIITRFSPFKPGVAYMSVPRCDSCANVEMHDGRYLCGLMRFVVAPDFGCVQWREKP